MGAYEYGEFGHSLDLPAMTLNSDSEDEIRAQLWAQHAGDIRAALAEREAEGWQPATELGPQGIQLRYERQSFRDWSPGRWVLYVAAGLLTGGILLVLLPLIWRELTIGGASYRVSLRRIAGQTAAPAPEPQPEAAERAKEVQAEEDAASEAEPAPPQKATAMKTATKKKATTKKTSTRKSAAKKAATKQKVVAKKKTTTKKPAAKKSTARKASSAKKAAGKKQATTKKTTRKRTSR